MASGLKSIKNSVTLSCKPTVKIKDFVTSRTSFPWDKCLLSQESADNLALHLFQLIGFQRCEIKLGRIDTCFEDAALSRCQGLRG